MFFLSSRKKVGHPLSAHHCSLRKSCLKMNIITAGFSIYSVYGFINRFKQFFHEQKKEYDRYFGTSQK